MEEQVQPLINSPIIETAKRKSSKKILIISFIALLLLIPLGLFGSKYLGNSNKKSEIVVNQKSLPSTVTSNVNNAQSVGDVTGNTEIDKEVKAVDDGLTNLDNSLNSVDQGLNDQPDNLQ